ncbi:MAG: hypothetical protein IPK26_24325, partial [Planctomycetes bacterium]|nr:hypothetical protein [Planctomycetota bacterium]
TGDATPAVGPTDPTPEQPETREEKIKRWQRVYDSVYRQSLATPLLGTVEIVSGPAGRKLELLDLEQADILPEVTIRLRQFSIEKESVIGSSVFPGTELSRIRLAESMRNQVAREVRAIPTGGGHLVQRGSLIAKLLQWARQDVSVYADAKAQAEQFLQDAGGAVEGLQWKLRVLRQMGDVAGEFELLSSIDGQHKGSAFQHEGLGQLQARLGLHADAEANLRQATAIAPLDSRPRAALAWFLVNRGRASEALPEARQALAGLGSVLVEAERVRVLVAAVSTHLALGDLTAAREVLSAQAVAPTSVAAFLRASIDYAAGDCKAALDGFRQATDSADGQAAQLGAAACLLRLEQWQEALAAFEALAEQAPLLRHRAWTGIALLHLRLGQYEPCLTWLERALEASPGDTYALYLRGRAQRLSGQLQAAQESLTAALRQRDDFVHAVAEMSQVYATTAASAVGAEQAAAAFAAMRYADRAVGLPKVAPIEMRELQGIRRFEAADPRGAEQAFAGARDHANTDEQKLWARGCLAVVDYTLGRYEDAHDKLRVLLELPRDHVLRKWADQTQALIDDHGQKELLEDTFARGEPGNVWHLDRDGELGATIANEALVFDGKWTKGEVAIWRTGAVARAARFLAVSATMQVGAGHRLQESFSGLRLQTDRGGSSGASDCQIAFGLRDGKPSIRIHEGREEPMLKDGIEAAGFDPRGVHRLELRVEPIDETSRLFRLICRWNDQVVYAGNLKVLNANNNSGLLTQFVASGPRGASCDVRFDDYRLERRKETK